VKVGSIKVRKPHWLVNDYIKLVLEKVNPKDFRRINLEVLGSNVVITDSQYQEEISHSTPSILSLGVYSRDKRYFGYIITELSSPNKHRAHCYVYRAARNSTAANIIDAISTSYQTAYSPRSPDNCDVNPIYTSNYANKVRGLSSPSSPNATTNPLYSRFHQNSRASGGEEANGRNSIISIASTATSIGSLHYFNNTSPDSSPSPTLKKESPSCGRSLIDRLNILKSNNRRSVNVESLGEEQKDLLIDFDQTEECKNDLTDVGSTETLLTLTPSSPCSPNSLPRSSPVTKRERPKSLPLLDLNDPFEFGNEYEV